LPGSIEGVTSVIANSTLERDELEIDEQGFVAAPYPRPIRGVPRERNLVGSRSLSGVRCANGAFRYCS
jgi:hypothetical protein